MSTAQAGFFSLTEVTDATQHQAYNEWHQLDHMPQQLPLAGIQHAHRWVLTPKARASAAVLSPPFDRVHYLTMYLMGEPLRDTLQGFHELGQALYRSGRWFDARISHFARPALIATTAAAPRVHISPDAVPYRPHTGIYAVIETPQQLPNDPAATLATIDGVAGAWTFRTSDTFTGLPWPVGDHRISIVWMDGDPTATSARITSVVHDPQGPFAAVQFAAPFEVITPWQWDWFDRAP